MLNYSELTVVKNADGVPSALGYPINSLLLENNKPLFISSGGGSGKKHKKTSKKHQKNDKVSQLEETDDSDYADDHDYDSLAVPAGLICMTETICRSPSEMYKNENDNEDTVQLIPEGLYEKLLALAEHKQPSKKYSRKKEIKSVGNKKNKTNKTTNKTNKTKKQSKK